MTEQYTIVGKCLGEITVKIWKQGGSVKCQDQTTNTYPKPSQHRINQIVSDACLSCSIGSDSKRIEVPTEIRNVCKVVDPEFFPSIVKHKKRST